MPGMGARGTTARANVNVALVKYWGKREPRLNLPTTVSISLTLEGLGVEANVAFGAGEADRLEIDGEVAAGEEAVRLSVFLDLVRAQSNRRERLTASPRNSICAETWRNFRPRRPGCLSPAPRGFSWASP